MRPKMTAPVLRGDEISDQGNAIRRAMKGGAGAFVFTTAAVALPYFSNSSAARPSSFTMAICCGHTLSHAPQPMHDDAGPSDAFQS